MKNINKNILLFTLIIFFVPARPVLLTMSQQTRALQPKAPSQQPLSLLGRMNKLIKIHTSKPQATNVRIKNIDERKQKEDISPIDINLQKPSYITFNKSGELLRETIEEAKIEKAKIEKIINEYETTNTTKITHEEKKEIDKSIFQLFKRAKNINQNFVKIINDSINNNQLKQKIVNDSIKNTQAKIHEQYDLSIEKKNKNIKNIVTRYYNDYLRKKYNQRYYLDYINKKIKTLEAEKPEIANQQPIIIKRNKKKDIEFYTELFNILEEMREEPIEEDMISENDQKKETITFEPKDKEIIEENDKQKYLITSRINAQALNRFIQKANSTLYKVDEGKINILNNIKASFDWVNNKLKKPHPSDKSSTFNQWFSDNITIPLVSKPQETKIEPVIINNIVKFLRESKEFPSEQLIKKAWINAAEQLKPKVYDYYRLVAVIRNRFNSMVEKINQKSILKLHIAHFVELMDEMQMPQHLRFRILQSIDDFLIKPINKLFKKQTKVTEEEQKEYLKKFKKQIMIIFSK